MDCLNNIQFSNSPKSIHKFSHKITFKVNKIPPWDTNNNPDIIIELLN